MRVALKEEKEREIRSIIRRKLRHLDKKIDTLIDYRRMETGFRHEGETIGDLTGSESPRTRPLIQRPGDSVLAV